MNKRENAREARPKGMSFAYIMRMNTPLPTLPPITAACMKSSLFPPLILLLVFSCAHPAWAAEPLIEAIDSQVKANQSAAASQKNIDALRDQTQRMLDEYRDALRQTEVLTAYNDHLRRLVESQRTEKVSLEKQIKDVEITRRDLVPLMLRMTETLQRFVQLDRPFLPEERSRRMAELNSLMGRADVSDAEKFRRLLEAYQIENEYGKTIEAYRAELQNGENSIRTVDFLRVGRIGLFYQSLDGRESGVWNNKTRHWEKLPTGYNNAIHTGLAIARKERAPELLPIPVEAPEAAP